MKLSLTQFTRQQAARLGFSLAGVTTPDPPPHWSSYSNWLALGRNAGMDYLSSPHSIECRAEPGRLMPGCRSILVLAATYPPPGLQQDPIAGSASARGRIAAYACGMDYHLVLLEKMESLVADMQEFFGQGFEYRCYTDTGPILERDLAQRAGLGWVGRNTCLINPHLGSYFFLAEVLLGIELEPDLPFLADRCGTCRRCQQVCPTGCIQPDRTLDAGRCLSYLTIENKSIIPLKWRPYMGQWVFGCDLCQMVCPWNRFSKGLEENTFSGKPVETWPLLAQELTLSAREFNQKYRGTALMRVRRNRYLRNVIVALVNSGQARSTQETLLRLSDDTDPLVREHALWAMETF